MFEVSQRTRCQYSQASHLHMRAKCTGRSDKTSLKCCMLPRLLHTCDCFTLFKITGHTHTQTLDIIPAVRRQQKLLELEYDLLRTSCSDYLHVEACFILKKLNFNYLNYYGSCYNIALLHCKLPKRYEQMLTTGPGLFLGLIEHDI